tara:strand:+ start:251 stop:883 length:633 start_codon:yes stop_codon:yes gene_type:complete
MYKNTKNINIFPLLIILTLLYPGDVNGQVFKVKKEKAVVLDKVITSQRDIPMVVETSMVFENAEKAVRDLDAVMTSGKYSYSMDKLTLDPLSSSRKNFSSKDSGLDIISANGRSVELNLIVKENLRVAIVGNSKRIMLTDGSFALRFVDNKDRNKFAQDYDLELVQEFPDFNSYKLKDFSQINDLMKTIGQDPRISLFELSLIDPNRTTN